MTATALAVAFVVFSCKNKLGEADSLDLSKVPLQTIENMFAVETDRGITKMRMEAPLMESYEEDTLSYEYFPKGLKIYAYAADGSVETFISSREAKHTTYKSGTKPEKWQAFGNVIIKNIPKREIMTTDTLYWDKGKHEIYTDCYVKMNSPSGFLQGYGMRSDERATNSILHNPFDSFSYTETDTTKVVIDTVNFIGPLQQ